MNLDIRYGRRFACRWKGGNSRRPTLRASGSRARVEAKSPDGDDPEEDEGHEHDELRLLERRFGVRRRERMQGRHTTKGHDDEDEEVEVERHDSGDDENPAPRPEELTRVARIHCDGENHERDNAHANCRGELVEGEAESGDAGQDGRDEE